MLITGAVICIFTAFGSRKLPILLRRRWKMMLVTVFYLNVGFVGMPGRFDSGAASMEFPWPSIFMPAGWTFAVWAIIFLGEAIGTCLEVSREHAFGAEEPDWRTTASILPSTTELTVEQRLTCISERRIRRSLSRNRLFESPERVREVLGRADQAVADAKKGQGISATEDADACSRKPPVSPRVVTPPPKPARKGSGPIVTNAVQRIELKQSLRAESGPTSPKTPAKKASKLESTPMLVSTPRSGHPQKTLAFPFQPQYQVTIWHRQLSNSINRLCKGSLSNYVHSPAPVTAVIKQPKLNYIRLPPPQHHPPPTAKTPRLKRRCSVQTSQYHHHDCRCRGKSDQRHHHGRCCKSKLSQIGLHNCQLPKRRLSRFPPSPKPHS